MEKLCVEYQDSSRYYRRRPERFGLGAGPYLQQEDGHRLIFRHTFRGPRCVGAPFSAPCCTAFPLPLLPGKTLKTRSM